jgi:type IV pilus assembly protein PilZ
MAAINGAAPRQGILSLTIKDKSALYAAYMPFIKGGGLFIPTKKEYHIGEEVFMLLSLMEDPEKLPVAGKIIWITPVGAQGNRSAGIGVQFSGQDDGQPVTRSRAISPVRWKASDPRIPCSAGSPPGGSYKTICFSYLHGGLTLRKDLPAGDRRVSDFPVPPA